MPDQPQRCRTCKWWDTWPAAQGRYGNCTHPNNQSSDDIGDMPERDGFLARTNGPDSEGGSGILIMGSHFGCIHHESRQESDG